MINLTINKVHEDERRSIDVIPNLLTEGREFSIIRLNKGKAVGGCYHSDIEYFCIIKGKVFVVLGDKEGIMYPGMGDKILPNTPHMFEAVGEEAIIAEWGIKTVDKSLDKKDVKLKELVDKINNE